MPRTTLLLEHYRAMPHGLQLYSVREEGMGRTSLAADFFIRMPGRVAERPELQEQWEAFVANLQRLDQRKINLLELDWLRDEGRAYALPSEARRLYRLGLHPPIDFRLYCFPAGPRTLILFSGDVKTHRDPNQCLQAGLHFRRAVRLAYYLEHLQDEWDIGPDDRLQPDPFEFDFY